MSPTEENSCSFPDCEKITTATVDQVSISARFERLRGKSYSRRYIARPARRLSSSDLKSQDKFSSGLLGG